MAKTSKAAKTKVEERVEPVPLISEVRVRNFRSIVDAAVEPGRLTVIVGANGSGKSNLLEAIAVGSAASAGMLGHEFLAARGIRPTIRSLLSPRFPGVEENGTELVFESPGRAVFTTSVGFVGTGKLHATSNFSDPRMWEKVMQSGRTTFSLNEPLLADMARSVAAATMPGLPDFLVYTPDYAALRTFSDEGQILPVGVRGEGLFQHLVDLSRRSPEILETVSQRLRVLDWFDGFVLPNDLGPGEKRLAIRDRYLEENVLLDQRAANEGFLFLLFVYVLLSSPDTPRFFAIDNADVSLNPKLCARLVADIAELARANDKQVILTTHNPAMLDGLDLDDDEQRLLACERNLDGHTTFRRIPAPSRPGVRLSEAFLRGYLGGLPGSF